MNQQSKINEGVLLSILVLAIILNFMIYAKSLYATNIEYILMYSLMLLIFATLIVQSIILLRIANRKIIKKNPEE
ncbi:MAG: hypothetical protein KAQ92_04895 [Candidatus Aenigmarchaeota archaeon]|nr:hypothetical protein [Candidatus Aenigmarchaeota archaeon]